MIPLHEASRHTLVSRRPGVTEQRRKKYRCHEPFGNGDGCSSGEPVTPKQHGNQQRGAWLLRLEIEVLIVENSTTAPQRCSLLAEQAKSASRERRHPARERMASIRVVAGCARALRNPKVMWHRLHELPVLGCSWQQLLLYCCGTASKMHFLVPGPSLSRRGRSAPFFCKG